MEQIVGQMIRAALAAGSEIMDVYSGDIAVEPKDDKSPLTEADRRSHDTIETMLKAAMNSGCIEKTPMLSEEGTTIPFPERAGWQRYFLIDPLDGTKEFIKHNGEFTVNIALMERDEASSVEAVWKPLVGVVYAPDLGELFVGSPEGAWWWGDVRGLAVPDIAEG